MEPAIIFLGAGGLAHECWETLLLTHPELLASARCFADPAPDLPDWSHESFIEVAPLSQLKLLPSLSGFQVVIAIGNMKVRHDLATDVTRRGGQLMNVRHPSASVGRSCTLAEGSIVLPHSTLTANVHLGRCSVVNPGVSISHDSVVGSFCNIGPGARVCGRVNINDFVDLGAGAVVLPDRRVEKGARVGAGAVVTEDVKPGVVVKGVPARP